MPIAILSSRLRKVKRIVVISAAHRLRDGWTVGGMVEGMGENVLAKKFFGSVEVDRARVGGPRVPLLYHGNDIGTPNWACRY